MRILLCGGGTGGHIYPALAIREIFLKKNSADFYYVGVKGGMEERIVTRIADLAFYPVRAQGMPRKLSLKFFSFVVTNFLGIIDAFVYLKNIKPDLIIATGGYVSFPVLAVAKLLKIKYLIHEQNAVMGLTNKLFASGATKVFLTFNEASESLDNAVFTGNPVRQEFLSTAELAKKNGFIKKDKFVILSVGGSGGATSINKALVELAKKWLPQNEKYHIIHISGERDYESIKEMLGVPPTNYELIPYLHEMKMAFDAADLIISRAGATILSEIGACGKPAILIPFPFATDDHQKKNALALEKMGAATLIEDSNLNYESLKTAIELLVDCEKLKKMSLAMLSSRPSNVEEKIEKELTQLLKETIS